MIMRGSLLSLLMLLALAGCATTSQNGEQSPEQKAARVNTQLGISYLRENQLEQAMDRLTKAVRQDPEYAEAHSVLAVLYHRLGEHDKAAQYYRRSVDLAPQDSAVLNNYGQFLCERGKIKEAEEQLARAVDNPLYRNPELPLTNAGTCLLRAGQKERAEQYFLRALQANPKFPLALFRMAQLRHEAGESMSARGFYQRYLAVAPQSPESLWLGIQIERVLGDMSAVGSYSLLLKGKFPDSEETRKLIASERRNG
jgi:type IV pilus assembly protein PilF